MCVEYFLVGNKAPYDTQNEAQLSASDSEKTSYLTTLAVWFFVVNFYSTMYFFSRLLLFIANCEVRFFL